MGTNDFNIIELRPNNLPLALLTSCASLYCQIWREPPWNEDFWQEDEVIKNIKTELAKESAKGFIALNPNQDSGSDGQVIAFTWGYRINQESMRQISGDNKLDGFFNQGKISFYIDELGVGSGYRHQGLGHRLTSKLINWVKQTDHDLIFLRTEVEARAARHLYSELGFKELDIRDTKERQRSYWLLQTR
jgi:ribosomal protein S18 acetylase RimI-like enzyme